jgi:hypothetical protein
LLFRLYHIGYAVKIKGDGYEINLLSLFFPKWIYLRSSYRIVAIEDRHM